MGSSMDSRYWTCPSCNKQFDWEAGHRRIAKHDPAKCMAKIESKDKPKKDTKFVYVVTAYRNGIRELHSYLVAVFSNEASAIAASNYEEEYRNGKYICEVIECTVEETFTQGENRHNRVIKKLPPVKIKLNQGKS